MASDRLVAAASCCSAGEGGAVFLMAALLFSYWCLNSFIYIYIYIYAYIRIMDTNNDHFASLALRVQGNYISLQKYSTNH